MPKPQWLKDKENGIRYIKQEPDFCKDCIHFGSQYKWTIRKGNTRTMLHECAIHPKCYNTVFSICCDDFEKGELV